jgi:hypothetical protein
MRRTKKYFELAQLLFFFIHRSLSQRGQIVVRIWIVQNPKFVMKETQVSIVRNGFGTISATMENLLRSIRHKVSFGVDPRDRAFTKIQTILTYQNWLGGIGESSVLSSVGK